MSDKAKTNVVIKVQIKMVVPGSTVFLFMFSLSFGIHIDILKPETSDGPDAALIIVPGASIEGIAYEPLGKFVHI